MAIAAFPAELSELLFIVYDSMNQKPPQINTSHDTVGSLPHGTDFC